MQFELYPKYIQNHITHEKALIIIDFTRPFLFRIFVRYTKL